MSGPLGDMRPSERAEWTTLWLDLRQTLFRICRESKDGYARVTDGGCWATPAGMTFRVGDVRKRRIGILWEETQINGMRRIHAWNWAPNLPYSPLERLAECAE